MLAGRAFLLLANVASLLKLASGIGTADRVIICEIITKNHLMISEKLPYAPGVLFGSMVQNGKFLASAIDFWAIALKSVLLPTLGSPTSPTFIFIDRAHLDVGACEVWL